MNSAPTRRVPAAPARRHFARLLLVLLLASLGAPALAQPLGAARLSPEERERLRRELRQQGDPGREPGRRVDEPGWRRERMAPAEREELRRQLRNVPHDDRRGRGWRRD